MDTSVILRHFLWPLQCPYQWGLTVIAAYSMIADLRNQKKQLFNHRNVRIDRCEHIKPSKPRK